ncbi:MAG: hypothetical protein GXO74_03230 [Calditrichaeota bacterium]|nr:hypothetical protein [Calditrichota bacterium]
MENFPSETPDKQRAKTALFLKKFFTLRRVILIGIVLIILIVEYSADFVEIFIGNALELTNSFRPKSGAIWELSQKDQIASDQLQQIAKNVKAPRVEVNEIKDLLQLRQQLDKTKSVMLSASKFKELYSQIPPRYSYDIIAPFDLLRLSHSRKWAWTKITKDENNLAFYFLDGDKQLLMDTYPPLIVLYNLPNSETKQPTSLDSMKFFQNRTFSPEQFFAAFDDLPNAVKLQLINNPYQLIQWDSSIKKVGISRYSIDHSVLLGFEILQGIYTEIYTFEASELAANYLIAHLNELYPELNLTFPERQYREHEYDKFE